MDNQPPTSNPDQSQSAETATKSSGNRFRLPSVLRHHPLRSLAGLLVLLVLVLIVLATRQTSQSHKVVHTAQVSINKDGFFPKLIDVKAGTTVTWTNYDANPHQVSSDPYPKDDKLASLNSLALAPNDAFSYTFNQTGTYTYHDNLNPFKLQGTVKVE